MCRRWFLLLLLLPLMAIADFIPQTNAFQVDARPLDTTTINITLTPQTGFYFYRDKLRIASSAPIKTIQKPDGNYHLDKNFGNLQVYNQPTTVVIELATALPTVKLTIDTQGCKAGEYCYPPVTQTFTLTMPHAEDGIDFQHTHLVKLIILFLGFGILLCLTPCVLPMIPIVSAMVLGPNKHAHFLRRGALASCYGLGIAISYGLIGFMAASTGKSLHVMLQATPFLLTASLILFALGLSMLDIFTLSIPLPKWLDALIERQRAGSLLGCLLMGVLSALVVSPCLTAPLASVLAYVTYSGDALLGASLLFILGIGLSLPLILVAMFGPRILPKSGNWLHRVKQGFGILLILIASWLAWHALPTRNTNFATLGASDTFQPIINIDQLNHIIETTSQPILINYTASWCIECQRLERFVLNDDSTQPLLQQFKTLRIDITKNDANAHALMERFKVFAPPTLILIGKDKSVTPLFGFISSDALNQKLISSLN